MKQEIVLPKFKVPGQTNWLMRGLWIAGAVVLVQAVVVAVVLSRKSGAKEEAERIASEQQRAQQAEQAAAAAAATTKPAAKPGPKSMKVLTQGVDPSAGTPVAHHAGATKVASKPVPARAGRVGRVKPSRQSKLFAAKVAASRRAAAARSARSAAATKPKPKAAGASKGKGDAIDDILRNFK